MGIIMHRFLRADFLNREDGTTAIEYALIAALIVTTIVAAIQGLGTGIANTLYNQLAALF